MPIYEYKCTGCGSVKEEQRTMSSRDEDQVCSECGAKSRRILSKSTPHFKGEGWETNDHKRC